jgi:hypothetical protein
VKTNVDDLKKYVTPSCLFVLLSNADATRALEAIEAAVKERLPSIPQAARKGGHVPAWLRKLRKQASDAKRMYKDQEELQDLGRKLQNAVDGFTVRGSPALSFTARDLEGCSRA